MIAEMNLASNKRNAQFSTGPDDPTRTRLNALTHGILSKETLIVAGDGQEDPAAFEELSHSLREDLAPTGALED